MSNRDVDFLFEMGNIRYIPRMWSRFYHPQFSNLAEHHFRVFWIAMIIAQHEGGDTGKIAKMVLVHDIAESRTGDLDYLSRQYSERNEKLAIEDMLADTSLNQEFLALWNEYEERDSIEAKIVKDADNLEIDLELAEQAANGSPLRAELQETRKYVSTNKLYTSTAKQLFTSINKTNPHHWHTSGRNRTNSGDWRDNKK